MRPAQYVAADTVSGALTNVLVPAPFAHVIENVYVPAVVIGPTCCDPPAAFLLPLQYEFPLAVQDDGLFVALQVIVAFDPVVILEGFTDMFTMGTAATVNVAVFVPLPAAFVHVKM